MKEALCHPRELVLLQDTSSLNVSPVVPMSSGAPCAPMGSKGTPVGQPDVTRLGKRRAEQTAGVRKTRHTQRAQR